MLSSDRCLKLLVACVGIVAVTTSLASGRISMIIVDLLSAGAVGLMWWAAFHHRGDSRLPWILLAAGMTLWLIGDLIWDGFTLDNGTTPSVSLADLFYLVGYPVLALGIVAMIRLRAPDRWTTGLIDGIAMAAAATAAAWQFLVVGSGSGAEVLINAAYPLADVLLIAVMVWLVLSPGIRGLSTTILLSAMSLVLVLDLTLAVGQRLSDSFPTRWFDNSYPIGYLLLALAAVHERSHELTLADPSPEDRLHPARVMFLGAALVGITFTGAFSGGHAQRLGRWVVPVITLGVGAITLSRFLRAVGEVEQARAELRVAATTDSLTGLDNRRRFLEVGTRILERCGRDGHAVSALMVDVDHFKEINDTFGHAAGDMVLRELADRGSLVIRPGDLFARVGGDEFILLLPGIGADAAAEVAGRFAAAVGAPPIAVGSGNDSDRVQPTLSIGAADTSGALTLEQLLAEADLALYESKRAGRARITVHATCV